MSRLISYAHREKIVQRRKRGESYSSIADAFNLSVSGVKKIWYSYQKKGALAFVPDYSNSGRRSPYNEEVRASIKQIRDNAQGGLYVATRFAKAYPDLQGPSARTLQRWWKKSGESKDRGRPSKEKKKME